MAVRRFPGDEQDDALMNQEALTSLMNRQPTAQGADPSISVNAFERGSQVPPSVMAPYQSNLGTSNGGSPIDPRVSGQITPNPMGTASGVGGGGTNSAWDTDGYSAPAYTTGSAKGVMTGWDDKKWNDPNNQHPKYVVGRILSQYSPSSDADFNAAVTEIQKAYPGTTTNGKDKVTIPGVGTIDMRQNAGLGGTAWQWLTGDTGGAAPAGAPQAAPMLNADGGAVSGSAQALTEPSVYRKLLEQIQNLSGPQATDQNALLSLMQR